MKLNSSINEDTLNKAVDDTLINAQNKDKDTQSNLSDVTDDFFDDILEKQDETSEVEDKPKVNIRFGKLTEDDRNLAAFLQLVPDKYKKAKFDKHQIIENIKEDWERSKGLYLTYNFEDYIDICTKILNCIRLGQLPPRSYIIGAPKGFGKASFVNECIMTLNKNCYRVAPYISLYELGEIRRIDTNNIMKPFSYSEYYEEVIKDRQSKKEIDKAYLTQYTKNGVKGNYHIEPRKNKGLDILRLKSPDAVYGQYSYSEYINSACLFVALSGIASKEVESQELCQLMNIRGMKGLPTIVTVGTSLDPYTADIELREQVWDDLLGHKEDKDLYDRLYHISTYKFKNISNIDSKDTYKDETTGIVYKYRGDNR